ncbi:MAG TPA: helix-turn-helix domain-containing protein [Caulobacteraceae bacterium]|jgi:DNA-binding HxlR family transcriptional regulator
MGWAEQFEKESCAIAAAVSVVGDPWTLLILRDAFLGVRRFEDFRRGLGVARSVLSARLKKLVSYGIMRIGVDELNLGRRQYLLTPMGNDLFPILLSLKAWGDVHIYGRGAEPHDTVHSCGHHIDPGFTCAACGQGIVFGDLRVNTRPAKRVGEALAAARG